MATAAKRTFKTVEDASDHASETLHDQIANLRKEIASISAAVSDYSGNAIDDVQHNAVAIAKEVRHQGSVVAKQVSRQASAAGKVVQENPVPALVALGVIALLSTLMFARHH